MAKFERVKRFINDDSINLPVRKTIGAAGYDFEVAEDIIIPSARRLIQSLADKTYGNIQDTILLNLIDVASLTKETAARPTLVPTGIKCKLDEGTYLELSVRSSCPLKYWLMLANGVGIIDRDYYGNPSNDGEIFFQIINLGPYDIRLQKGDIIGQGIIKPYFTVEDEFGPSTIRTGGFGSTSN